MLTTSNHFATRKFIRYNQNLIQVKWTVDLRCALTVSSLPYVHSKAVRDSFESSYIGASRLELCTALSDGGLTPSIGLLQTVMAKVQIPVHALIRPRGGDFLYTTDEFECMCLDATLLLNAGAAGIVVGCLHVNGSVDIPRIERMVEIAGHRQVTFHRGF